MYIVIILGNPQSLQYIKHLEVIFIMHNRWYTCVSYVVHKTLVTFGTHHHSNRNYYYVCLGSLSCINLCPSGHTPWMKGNRVPLRMFTKQLFLHDPFKNTYPCMSLLADPCPHMYLGCVFRSTHKILQKPEGNYQAQCLSAWDNLTLVLDEVPHNASYTQTNGDSPFALYTRPTR